jgi:3-phenylpropionate/cinnamic acid dioxygenase small subunit
MHEATIREVEQFLYREARLLDERRFHEWLELFTADVRYWMGGRRNRYPKSSKAIAILDPDRYVEADLTEDAELAILDENKQTLSARVARLDTGMAWAEDPPSRTRHLLTNIEIEQGDAESELEVYSNFIVYRSRSETEQDFYVGARRDVLRRVDGAWKIARRKLILDQNVLLVKNVSIFFEAEEFGQWAARRSPLKPEHSEFEGSD